MCVCVCVCGWVGLCVCVCANYLIISSSHLIKRINVSVRVVQYTRNNCC